MIEGLIGAVVGGIVVNSLSSKSSKTEKTYVIRHQNELIEYHKWLEKIRAEKEAHDIVEINSIYEDRRTRCPHCGKKIEFKNEVMHEKNSFADVLVVTISCNCKRFSERLCIPQRVGLLDGDTKEDIYGKIADVIKSLYEKITGKIDYEKLKTEYMDRKLKEKEYLEKYYGNV